jgi:hypothetical protein
MGNSNGGLRFYERCNNFNIFIISRDPPQIPLTRAEKQKMEKEKKKRALEAREAAKRKNMEVIYV